MAAPEARGLFAQGDRAERLHDLRAGAAQRRRSAESPAEPVGAVARREAGRGRSARACASMDAVALTDGAARAGYFPFLARSTAACCRASWSRCSIAASRRRCRSSRASTAARSARCDSWRRRCRPTRRPMRRRSASATRDLADAIPASSIRQRSRGEHARDHARRAVWLDRRAAGARSRPRSACRRSSTTSITAIRPRMQRACTPSMPARCRTCSARPTNAAALAEGAGDAGRDAAVRCDARLLGELRAQRRADARQGSPPGRRTAPSAPTWPSKTRRGRRRI